MHFEFTRPDLLSLLLLLPIWALLVWPRAGRGVFYTRAVQGVGHGDSRRTPAALILLLPRLLTAAAMASLVFGLAGLQRVDPSADTVLDGHSIGLVVDLSSSMLAEDMGNGESRIAVAREAATRFARRRTQDELSLVGFGSDAVTRVPPTTDYELIVHGVQSLEIQLVRDGTDISGAVMTMITRLLESEREPRVIVLLTDGAHNGAELPPLATARAAEALGIRIHAISVLSPETEATSLVSTTLRGQFGDERETVLQGLSGITGGQYFRASSPAALDSIYDQIDRMEKPVARLVQAEVRQPLRVWLFLLGLTLLAAETLLRGSRWGVIH